MSSGNDDRELSPEQVIAWLRSPEGENWSAWRRHSLHRHFRDSGLFADVLEDIPGDARARWPEPFNFWDLDNGAGR